MKRICILVTTLGFLSGPLSAETISSEESVPAAEAPASAAEEEWKSLAHGVRYRVLHEGDGTRAALWASVYLHYRVTAEDGTVLANTYTDREHGRRAHKHVIGSGTLAEALEMAVTTMRERDRRVFRIPAELFNLYDFHTHNEGDVHNDDEHDAVVRALRPGSTLQAEISLLWVRPFDTASNNRFRMPGDPK